MQNTDNLSTVYEGVPVWASPLDNRDITAIHIFNPEHDYALADGNIWYTPGAAICRLRRDMALVPADWARPGDAILLPDDFDHSLTAEDSRLSGITTISLSEIVSFISHNPHSAIIPWGWNRALAYRLRKNGVPDDMLPPDSYLENLRMLSHRRIASRGNEILANLLADIDDCAPVPAIEFHDTGAALDFYHCNTDCYFKAPWSSSGRGVIYCGDLELRHIEPWLRGIIRRQGSVMAETRADRVLDFASEWYCHGGVADFIGHSIFATSGRGKYHGNLTLPQSEITTNIINATPGMTTDTLQKITEAQQHMLNKLISSGYQGYLGIDMLTDRSGQIRPCIEINLRLTMGIASLMRAKGKRF